MRIDLIYFDAGGGHRAAAEALMEVMRRLDPQQQRWQPRFVHLQEVLDPIDPLRRFTGKRMQDSYNDMLKTGMTLFAPYVLPMLHILVRALHSSGLPVLQRYWSENPPDIGLSLVPNFNRLLREGLALGAPKARFVNLLTDMADYPPHFWIEKHDPQHPQYVICGTARAVEQAIELGHPRERVFLTSGMILHPRFYDQRPALDRAEELRALGLDPERPTALVLFGGEGSRAIVDIAERLHESSLDVQAIFLCGRNKEVLETLQNRKLRYPFFATGFSKEIPRFMCLGSFLIGKPGPGCVSEALAMGLPVIVESNAWTLPQERFNAEWVEKTGVGLVVRDFKRVEKAVAEMLVPENLARFTSNATAVNNRAIFEVPEMLERIASTAARSVTV